MPLVERIRKEYGTSKDIWSWSGYTFEELLLDSKDKLELLSKIDILVDGRFQEELKDLTLQFRGVLTNGSLMFKDLWQLGKSLFGIN